MRSKSKISRLCSKIAFRIVFESAGSIGKLFFYLNKKRIPEN